MILVRQKNCCYYFLHFDLRQLKFWLEKKNLILFFFHAQFVFISDNLM